MNLWKSLNSLMDRNKLPSKENKIARLRKAFSQFYYHNSHLVAKYHSNLKTLLRQGLSQPDIYGDVISMLRKILRHNHFDTCFCERIRNFIKICYDRAILQRIACLVILLQLGQYAFLFYNCTVTGQMVDSMTTSGLV